MENANNLAIFIVFTTIPLALIKKFKEKRYQCFQWYCTQLHASNNRKFCNSVSRFSNWFDEMQIGVSMNVIFLIFSLNQFLYSLGTLFQRKLLESSHRPQTLILSPPFEKKNKNLNNDSCNNNEYNQCLI